MLDWIGDNPRHRHLFPQILQLDFGCGGLNSSCESIAIDRRTWTEPVRVKNDRLGVQLQTTIEFCRRWSQDP